MTGNVILSPRNLLRQRGFGLLEAGLLTGLLGAVVLAGFAAMRVHEVSVMRAQNQSVLARVDQQLVTFASLHHRLPCPDLDRDGREDLGSSGCTSGAAKGWLPYRTLGLDDPSSAARQLLYLVQRGGVDLAAPADDAWRPLEYKNDTVGYSRDPGRVFNPVNIGAPDFCSRLQALGALTLDATIHAHLNASPPRLTAYAFAHPGRGLGAQGFELANANLGGLSFESPEKTAIPAVYDDEVRVRTASQLEMALDCRRLLPGLDQVSLGAEVVEEVNSQKVWNTVTASVLTGIHAVKGVIAAVKLVKAGIQVSTAVGYMTTATAELSAAIAGCAVLVGCAAIPHAIASVAAATVSIAASTAAAIATGASMTATVAAGVMTTTAAIMAGASIPQGFNLDAAKAQALAARNEAVAAKNQAQTKYNEAVVAEAALLATKNSRLAALYAAGQSAVQAANALAVEPNVVSSINRLDIDVTVTTTAADAWMNAVRNQVMAEEAYANAQRYTSGGSTDYTATLASIQSAIDAETDAEKKAQMIAARNAIQTGIANSSSNASQIASIDAQLTQIQTRIDALNTDIANESDASTRTRLIGQRDELMRQKNELYAQKLNLTTDVNAALTNRNQAVAAAAAARTGFDTAIGYLVYNATYIPYQVKECTTTGSGSSAFTTCIMHNRTYNGSTPVRVAIDALYEQAGGLEWDGVYFRWWLAGQTTASRLDILNRAASAETQAQTAYDNIAALANGSATGQSPQLVWNGWQPVLQRADGKGGAR